MVKQSQTNELNINGEDLMHGQRRQHQFSEACLRGYWCKRNTHNLNALTIVWEDVGA